MITSFSDPEVEQGGFIRDIVNADITTPTTEDYQFYFLSFYGTGADINSILASTVAGGYLRTGALSSGSYEYWVEAQIPTDALLGTYSCATIIAEDFDGSAISGIYDVKIDSNVLTIVSGLGASIISTDFMRLVPA